MIEEQIKKLEEKVLFLENQNKILNFRISNPPKYMAGQRVGNVVILNEEIRVDKDEVERLFKYIVVAGDVDFNKTITVNEDWIKDCFANRKQTKNK